MSQFTYVCSNSLVASHQRLATIPQIEVTEELTTEECQTKTNFAAMKLFETKKENELQQTKRGLG